MTRTVRRLLEDARTSFFLLPAAAVIVAFIAGRLIIGVDVGDWVGLATVDSTRAVLSTVAAATITFSGISFSVSLLVMQQASAQLSPRVIPGLTRDPFHRRVIALVVGTFTYCLVVLQRVRGPIDDGGEAVVASFAAAVGLLLGIGSVLAVIAAIHHTSRQMDVSKILDDIVRHSLDSISMPGSDKLRRVDAATASWPPAPTHSVVRAASSGWVRHVDFAAIADDLAPGSTVRIEVVPGRYVVPGTILATCWPAVTGTGTDVVAACVRRNVTVGPTRTMLDDPGLGLRQLVDVALKALSPGVNDPTTAQDAIFHMGTVLAAYLRVEPAARAFVDDAGRSVLVPEAMTDVDLARLALAELRRASADNPAVSTYLMEMVADVVEAVHDDRDRTAPLIDQIDLLMADIERAVPAGHDLDELRDAYTLRFGARTLHARSTTR